MNTFSRAILLVCPRFFSPAISCRVPRMCYLQGCKFSSNVPSVPQSAPSDDLAAINSLDDQVGRINALDECVEDVSHYAPYQVPSYNVAKFVNKSETLKELVKLGVDFYRIEKDPNVCEALLKLNMSDIKPYLQFLVDTGVSADSLGQVLSKAPGILVQDLDNLKVRIHYLQSKKFDNEAIARIVTIHPKWLLLQTQDIDERLGYWQMKFDLKGHEVRFLVTRRPRLFTMERHKVEEISFCLKEEMGFTEEEMKQILLTKPRVFTTGRRSLVERWEVVTTEMKLDQATVVRYPDLLINRKDRLRSRHRFLVETGRAQYDSTKPHYISPLRMLEGDDSHFAVNVAGVSATTYNTFLKSL